MRGHQDSYPIAIAPKQIQQNKILEFKFNDKNFYLSDAGHMTEKDIKNMMENNDDFKQFLLNDVAVITLSCANPIKYQYSQVPFAELYIE